MELAWSVFNTLLQIEVELLLNLKHEYNTNQDTVKYYNTLFLEYIYIQYMPNRRHTIYNIMHFDTTTVQSLIRIIYPFNYFCDEEMNLDLLVLIIKLAELILIIFYINY